MDERELTEAEEESAKTLIESIGDGERSDGSSTKKGWVYHKIPFSGFDDVQVHKTACVAERDLVVKDLEGFDYKTVLDVGCSVGWFSFYFARLGKSVLGIEADTNVFKVIKFLRDKSKVDMLGLWNGSFDDSCPMSYDVVLFLNVHMWIEKQIGLHRTRASIKGLDLKRFYFQTAHEGSSGMAKAKGLRCWHDIVSYLNSCSFSKVKLIGQTGEHGGIRYLFRAER